MTQRQSRQTADNAATNESTDAENDSSDNYPSGLEKRRHTRVTLHVPVRFLLPDNIEKEGQLLDISAGGLAIKSTETPNIGDNVIAYIDNLGRFAGAVARSFDGGFAIEIDSTQRKQDRLAEQLALYASGAALDTPQIRQHVREAMNKNAELRRSDGTKIQCRITDMSLGGLAIEIADRPPIGEIIQIGNMEGRVIRHSSYGIGIEFGTIAPRRRGLTDGIS